MPECAVCGSPEANYRVKRAVSGYYEERLCQKCRKAAIELIRERGPTEFSDVLKSLRTVPGEVSAVANPSRFQKVKRALKSKKAKRFYKGVRVGARKTAAGAMYAGGAAVSAAGRAKGYTGRKKRELGETLKVAGQLEGQMGGQMNPGELAAVGMVGGLMEKRGAEQEQRALETRAEGAAIREKAKAMWKGNPEDVVEVVANPEGPKAQYHHHRKAPPECFAKESYRTVPLRHTTYPSTGRYAVPGALAIVGRIKGRCNKKYAERGVRVKYRSYAIQSILTPKSLNLRTTSSERSLENPPKLYTITKTSARHNGWRERSWGVARQNPKMRDWKWTPNSKREAREKLWNIEQGADKIQVQAREAMAEMESNPTAAAATGGRHWTRKEKQKVMSSWAFKKWRKAQHRPRPEQGWFHAFMSDVGHSAERKGIKKWPAATDISDVKAPAPGASGAVDVPSMRSHYHHLSENPLTKQDIKKLAREEEKAIEDYRRAWKKADKEGQKLKMAEIMGEEMHHHAELSQMNPADAAPVLLIIPGRNREVLLVSPIVGMVNIDDYVLKRKPAGWLYWQHPKKASQYSHNDKIPKNIRTVSAIMQSDPDIRDSLRNKIENYKRAIIEARERGAAPNPPIPIQNPIMEEAIKESPPFQE